MTSRSRRVFVFLIFSSLLFNGMTGAAEFPLQETAGVELAAVSTSPDKITLDIKGMDVVEVLKIFASRYGMNISVGRNVTGKVILFLKNVDVLDAFEIVISGNDLAYEKKNGILNVMSQRDYEMIYGERYQDKQVQVISLKYARAADLLKVLTQVKTSVGKVIIDEVSNKVILIDTPKKVSELEEIVRQTDVPLETRIFRLNYASAEKASAKIQETLTRGVGSFKFDERSNIVVVTDSPRKLNEVENILKAIDGKPSQVLIDAQIIELKPSDKFSSGVDWEAFLARDFRMASTLPAVGAVNKLYLGVAAKDVNGTPGEGEYKGIVSLLNTLGDVKILSCPRIVVLNNQEAKIHVGTRQPYVQQTTVTGDGGAITTSDNVTFIDVGIKLNVTPTINNDGYITMKIRPEVSSADDSLTTSKGEKIPIVSTAETETTVILKDGVTVIIGGLKRDLKNYSEKKVPYAGDLPLIGNAFKNKSDERSTADLVILLTPHLMTGDSAYTESSQIKPRQGSVTRMSANGDLLVEKIDQAMTLAKPAAESSREALSNYYSAITERIKTLARSATDGKIRGEARVFFTLASAGELTGDPKVIRASDDTVGNLALTCVKKSSPFPRFPDEIKDKEQSFNIVVNFGSEGGTA